MNVKTFVGGIRAVLVSLPFGKKIESEDLQFLWLTIDDCVKDSVTDEMWMYGCRRLLETWSDNNQSGQPIHMQILGFIYKNQNGKACLEWGIKDEVCEQFNLPRGYGSNRLQGDAAGRHQKGLLDSGEPRPSLPWLVEEHTR